MYKNGRLPVMDFVELQSDIEAYFRKHPGYELKMCDIRLFAVPQHTVADVMMAVSRLVKQGILERRCEQIGNFFSTAWYRLK